MYSSKRIFTKNDTNLNYVDYNKLKNGCEILKTIKKEDNIAVLNQFINYQNWQTLSSAYFPFIDNNTLDVNYIENLYDSNESYIDKCIDYDKTMCDLDKNTLYPYGKIVSKKVVNPQFPSDIYLCKWCNNKSIMNIKHECVEKGEIDRCNCKKEKCKKYSCNLCKNAKPLFI